jgi:exopolysaccharide biosynthesis protein
MSLPSIVKIRRFNNNLFRPLQLFFILCALCVLSSENTAQDFKTVHDGVEYAQVEHKLGDDPVKINLLRLNLTKVRLDVQHAMDAAIGTEKTSSIAMRHDGVAAINAGFFRLDKSQFAGDAAGVLMIDGKLLSESTNNKIAAIIGTLKRSQYVFFGHVHAYVYLNFGEGMISHSFQVSGVNRERKKNEMVIYDSSFGTSTLTKEEGVEISLRRCKRGKGVDTFSIISCKRSSVAERSVNMQIPRDGFVISAGPDFLNDRDASIVKFRQVVVPGNKRLRFQIKTHVDDRGGRIIDKNLDVINGVPQLIKDGKVDITWEQEKASRSFAETRHPRTAIAKLKDGRLLMMTVDGRQPGVSVGMSLQELAEYLLSIGAMYAMNLDGGGSTTMFLDGKVVNKPSDKEGERKVGDAILVTLRRKAGGKK